MNQRIAVSICVFLAVCDLLTACANNGGNAAVPGVELTSIIPNGLAHSQTHLWGFYDVYIDIPSQTATAVLNREAMFTANVTTFINGKPAALGFHINKTPIGADYIDVDIDVSLTHPFPGLPQYHGYDVRGVFMGDGSASLNYNPDLIYPVLGFDQYMLADPVGGNGAPDGYTRWFNLPEFSTGGMPLFQYTPGKMAAPGFAGTSTLNPYRYFADGLGTNDDLWTWLNTHGDQYGRFSSGATNTRNYYLRFPNAKGIKYGYAVIADWAGTQPEQHPSNAPEAVALSVIDTSDVYFVDPGNNGGNLILDISLWDWDSQISAGAMEDYKIFIESTVLSGVYEFNSTDMTPTGGTENYSTCHVEIPVDNVQGAEDNEYWVIAQQQGYDYTNEFGVPNLADTDPLAAFFRIGLHVLSDTTEHKPICDLVIDPESPAMPFEGWGAFGFDASGSYDIDGDDLTFTWDFNNDGIFGDSYAKGTSDHPWVVFDYSNQQQVCVKVSDGKGGEAICCVDVDITAWPSKNIELRSGVDARDLAIDHTNGDLLVAFNDNHVYKYTRSSGYQNGSSFIYWAYWDTFGLYRMDMSHARYTMIGSTYANGYPGGYVFNPGGGSEQDTGHGGPLAPSDAVAMTDGDYENDLGMILSWDNGGGSSYSTNYARYSITNDWYPPYWHWSTAYAPYDGPDQMPGPAIKGVESDATGSYIWFMKDPGYYASRWFVTGSTLTYDNAYFGTGAQSDDDTSWYNGKDITRDNQNRYFILDELSTGEPRVKVWTVDGDITTSLGGFGDSTSISGTPLRIEGSDYDGIIVVLHGNTPPYMISVFLPEEMP